MKKNKLLLLVILLLGVGFALVSTTLLITGNVKIATNNADFDVKFTKAVLDGTDISSTAIKENGKKITFGTSNLSKVGVDISRLDFEVTNNSTMYDAEVSINCTAAGEKSSYYEITKEVASPIEAGTTKEGKVEVSLLKAPVDDIHEEFSCTLTATATERDTKVEPAPAPATFADDSWATIVDAVKSGTYPYQVGDTKEVDLGETLGKHTLRVANTSLCTNGETSETACGFVLEFADIITAHAMNSTNTNVGGWPASAMRTYVNSDIYNALPSDLKAAIVDTTVVSGYGKTAGETNFTSTDKLYLLSTKEVYGTSTSYDTVDSETRQLDYYKENGVTSSNYGGAIKKNGSSSSYWWLRSAFSDNSYFFYGVRADGDWFSNRANTADGVSPSFRIA